MSLRRARAVSMATTLTCLLGLAACSDEGQGSTTSPPSPEAAAEAPARIDEDWSTRTRVLTSVDEVRMTADVFALASGKRMRGFDRRTGEELWTVTPPGDLDNICFTSEQVSPDGIVGVLMAGRGRDCTVAGAVDLERGKLLWTRTMPSAPPYHSGRSVSVGDTTLTAEMFCDEMRRFSLKDGTPLRTLAPRDRKCAMESASNGQLIAVLNDPVTPRTPDALSTGWIPAVEEAVGLELYDADSGKLLWRRTVSNEGANVDDVVATRPAILTRTLRGHKLTQIYSRGGRPGPYLGKKLPAFNDDAIQALGHTDGLLVATYEPDLAFGSGQIVYGYDDRTGEERWRLPVPAGWVPIGVSGGGLLMTGASTAGEGLEQWLTRYDLDDPSQVETLGRVGGASVLSADDTTIFTTDGKELTAYPLPASGTEGAPELADPLAVEWAEDDVRPEDVAEACDAITTDTLTGLGFRSPGLPRPVDCRFAEYYEPEYLDRVLAVDVQVVQPNPTEGLSATEAAEAAAVDVAAREGASRADRILGDESWSSLDATGMRTTGSMVARWRNVIVTVTAEQEVNLDRLRRFSVPAREVAGEGRAAKAQVLEAISGSVDRRLE
jgi:hypothetical protein